MRSADLASRRADRIAMGVAFAAGLILYGAFAWRLAQGAYSEYYNLAFDFDPAAYVALFSHPLGSGGGFKHPLLSLVALLVRPMEAFGVAPKLAAAVPSVLAGSATLALCFAVLRAWGIGRMEAIATTTLYAVTATQIVTSILPESYGLASFSIAWVWLIAAHRQAGSGRLRVARYAAGALAFGVTITNAIQPVIAEAAVWVGRLPVRAAARRIVAFSAILGLACVALWIVVQWDNALWAAHNPVLALKHAYWQRTTGWRTGPGMVAATFLGFSFVAPRFTTIILADGLPMQDFREFVFPGAGLPAFVLWLGFLAAGTAVSLARPRSRPLALGLAACVAYSLLLHLRVQFRGSLFIYAAHVHFAAFMLAAGLAHASSGSRRARAAYCAAVLGLAALVGTVNLSRAADLVTRFDKVDVPCPKPCA